MTAASTNDGTVTTTPNPVKVRINTKDLLALLAQDEHASGNYDNTNFPAGSHLVILGDIPSGDHIDFQVQDRNGGELVDVSDIIKLEYGTNVVYSGKTNNSYLALIYTLYARADLCKSSVMIHPPTVYPIFISTFKAWRSAKSLTPSQIMTMIIWKFNLTSWSEPETGHFKDHPLSLPVISPSLKVMARITFRRAAR